jgi:DNA-binding transcriptional LysR family regulator
VRLGAIVAAVPDLIPEAFVSIRREQPTLSLSLVTDTSDALLALLQGGRLDLMLGRSTGLPDGETLHFEPLIGEDLHVIVRPGHPLLARVALTLAELAGEQWILQPEASAMRRALAAAFTLLQLPLPQHPVETASMLATVSILAHTDLIGVVPSGVATYFATLGAVRRLPVQLPPLLEPFGLITVRDRPVSPALIYVTATLRAIARGMAAAAPPAGSRAAAPSDHIP